MRIIKYIFLLIIVIINCSTYGQFNSEKEKLDYANDLFEKKLFIDAEPEMLNFLSTKNNTEFNFKYGVCALFKYADKSKSLKYLDRAVKDPKVDPRAYFYLGKANHFNYMFADALSAYKKYKSLVSPKDAKSLEVDMHIKMCESGQSLMKNLSDLIVMKKTSTGIDKFAYSYDIDEIGGKILITDQFQSKIDEKLNYKSIIYFPPVGQDVLFFSSYGKDGKTGLDIYLVNRMSTGEWSEPVRLPESINTPYDDSYPYLKPDGKTLYFSSKGHNSMGGYDIFRCSFDKLAGNYGPVNNLDYKINTPADDILYIVDDKDENASFSSDRSSDGGKIDVYNVKVKVFPIQNTLIAGTFFNSSNPEDLKANIKVYDVKTDKLIGVYTVDDQSNYSILLPSAGRYKFVIETPLSEKIHAGLVEVKPQTELKALKQEIELISDNGVEKLEIRNLFDKSHENESKILAAAVKEMANPEVNIDQIPDSILSNLSSSESEDNMIENLDETQSSDNTKNLADSESISQEELITLNEANIENVQSEINDLENQKLKSKSMAYNKSVEAEQKAKKADELLAEALEIDDPKLKNEKLKNAALLNIESKNANESSKELIELSKSIEKDIDVREENLTTLESISKTLKENISQGNSSDITNLEDQINEITSTESNLDNLINESKEKEKKANAYLSEAQALRADKESMQYQLDKQRDDLSRAKKKKDINNINENISVLETKINESEDLIKEQFKLYEETEQERKNLSNQIELVEKVAMSDNPEDVAFIENINIDEIKEKNQSVDVNYIEKNSNDFQIIEAENNLSLEDDIQLDKASSKDDQDINNISISDTLIQPEEKERYDEVTETLQSSTTDISDFEDVTQTIISYDNEGAQQQADELEQKKENIISIQNEINSLEKMLSSSTKPKEIQKIQETIDVKQNLLSNSEDQLIKSFEEINEKEIEYNQDKFQESNEQLSEEAKADEDFLSATYYMESASNAINSAKEMRKEADLPTTSPDRRKELLKYAYQNEMVAIDDQQTANNLMEDVVKKYPEEKVEKNSDDIVQNDQLINEEKRKEEELIENLPIDIPIAKNESKVEPVIVNGEIFDVNSSPLAYEVVAVPEDIPIVEAEEVEISSNIEIIEKNQKNIKAIEELNNQSEILELQKNDLINPKLVAKVDKKILKIEKKKAKSQVKIASDIKKVNESEISVLTEKVESSKNKAKNVEANYKFKQAENYSESATKLAKQAEELRIESNREEDVIKKAELIEKAISAENTSINYLKKSQKLYEDAIIEDFSDDKLTVAKSIQNDTKTQSERLDDLALASEDQAIKFQKRAEEIRGKIKLLPKKEIANALVIAQQYDDLALEEKNKAEDFKLKAKNYKEIEMALVKDISLAKQIENQDMSEVVGSQEFKDYNNRQNELNNLASEREEIKNEKRDYEILSDQMSAKSASLAQQAKAEKNPIKKADLMAASEELSKKAKENKEIAMAMVITIDSLKEEINKKELDQDIILSGLDSTTAMQVRGLAVSGKADEVLANIERDISTYEDNIEEESKNNIEELSTTAEIDIQPAIEEVSSNEEDDKDTEIEISSSEELVSNNVIRSKDFVPPPKIEKDIFLVTQDAVYSEKNPIPLNPKPPRGLVFKVQVGAFRNPIPQDLFKGFAPISAEKVRDDITRYRVGYFTSFDIANQSKNKVRELGYRDAFVVALLNGDRITISEARNMQSSYNVTEEIAKEENTSTQNTTNDNNIEENKSVETTSIDVTQNEIEINVETVATSNENEFAQAEDASNIDGLFYSVQVGAFSRQLPENNELNVTPLIVSKVNNLFKYSTGQYNDLESAARRKSALLESGILDAFIIAFSNGRIISLDQANSSNPDREVEYTNPEIFYIDFGTYKEDVPKEISDIIMNLRSLNIKSRPMLMGKQFYSKKYNTLKEAEDAIGQAKDKGLNVAKIVKSLKDDFDLNNEFRIDLGTYYEKIPDKLSEAFENLKDLELQTIQVDDGTRYYTKVRDNYEDASTDLNACRLQKIKVAKIVVFKGGVETSLDNILQSFK